MRQLGSISLPAHACALRKGRVSIQNQCYLVTTVTRARRPVFRDLSHGRIVVQALRYAALNGTAQTIAFVVMPDHLHWLFSLSAEIELSTIVSRMKRHTARRINRVSGTAGACLWQRGFHDHALRYDEDIRAVARYIVANPLRAGLVKCVGDYPLWDAEWL